MGSLQLFCGKTKENYDVSNKQNKYSLSNVPSPIEISMRMLHLYISYSRQVNMPKCVAVEAHDNISDVFTLPLTLRPLSEIQQNKEKQRKSKIKNRNSISNESKYII